MSIQLSIFDDSLSLITAEPAPEPPEEKLTPYRARTFYDAPQNYGDTDQRKRGNKSSLRSDDPLFIYQNYTGNGGLHGVEFKDYGNFHDYTKAKQEYELGQFFTPAEIARLIVEMLEIEEGKHVADIGCGMGQFFNHLKDCELFGIEVEEDACQVARTLYPEADIRCADLRYLNNHKLQDYIVGNPPFNLLWEDRDHPLASSTGRVLSQDIYVYQCERLLKEGGFFAFICPATWLNDELRHGKINEFIKDRFVPIFNVSLPETAFRSVGVNSFATKILGYQKKIPDHPLEYEVFTGKYDDVLDEWRASKTIRQFHEYKRLAFRYQARQKFTYYLLDRKEMEQKQIEERKYRKLLYELRRIDPQLADKTETSRREISKAKKPENMKWDEWERTRPTLKKLIARMKRLLRRKPPKNIIRLVKSDNRIRLKAYSREARRALNALDVPTEWNRNKLINAEHWQDEYRSFQASLRKISSMPLFYRTKERCVPIEYRNFAADRYLQRKQRETKRMRADISTLNVPETIRRELENLRLGDKQLFPHQVEDIGKALMKPAALLNWEMGTGKTLSAIAWSLIRQGRTLVVAPSLLIRKTWQEELNGVNENRYRVIEKISDLEFCDDSRYVLISLERLPKYYKRLRKLRFKNLILDESDNIKNRAGQRAKALKAVAGKIRHKLILTGTFTRNNACEAYSQLELLLNNSPAMVCEVATISEYDRFLKEYVEKPNPVYQLPYPAYGGSAVFRKNFSPKKTTVFGAGKTNQELYNKAALEKLLKSVRLRRKFNEIKPEGVTYNIQQVTVPMNPAEVKVYNYIFDDFVRTAQKMYEQDHDGKVAKMLVIMRQIMALLQGVSHPWTFPQYDGPEITSKMGKVIEIIRNNPGKKVMFGSPWKPTVGRYASVLAREFKVILLESELPITKRNQLIQEFREGDSQVLISTIGVLKAGVNIPEAQFVITDSYPWNYAQLSQYFFRAIRLNAKNHTQVYCLSSEGSFDTNVFNLMLAKERVNRFIADGDEVETKKIAGDFGVNEEMLECAIKMTKERVGGQTRSTVTWGESTVSDGAARAET